MITRPRDLRTGRPVWRHYRAPSIPLSKMRSRERADVVVVGAGVSGAMVAEALAEEGMSLVMLDRRGPLRGSTAATTALLQYEIDLPMVKMARVIGRQDTVRAWRRSRLGLENLAAHIERLGLRCRAARRPSVYLAGDVLDAEGLREELAFRNAAGFYTEYLTAPRLKERFGLRRSGALVVPGDLELDPVKLASGLLLRAISLGVRVFAPVTVETVEPHARGVSVHTDAGSVEASHLIFATGYEIPRPVKLKGHQIHSTWAISTPAQPGKLWPERAFIWESSDPYLYVRATYDGRVICGGEDEEFTDEQARDALIPAKTAILQRKLAALLPQLDVTVENAWTGCFGGTSNDLPTIDAVPGLPNCYALLAFGGNGITFSRIAAEVMRSVLTGGEDPDADLFRFAKKR